MSVLVWLLVGHLLHGRYHRGRNTPRPPPTTLRSQAAEDSRRPKGYAPCSSACTSLGLGRGRVIGVGRRTACATPPSGIDGWPGNTTSTRGISRSGGVRGHRLAPLDAERREPVGRGHPRGAYLLAMLMCGRPGCRCHRIRRVSTARIAGFHDAVRFADRENLDDYHPASAVNSTMDDDADSGEEDDRVAAVLAEVVALFVSAGWDASLVVVREEHVAYPLADVSSRRRAVEGAAP